MPADRYAEIHSGHRWDIPDEFNIAAACCGRWASDRTRFALYWEDESGATSAHSFWDLQREANRLSNVLAGLGVARGDKVALILPQRRETAVAHIAVYQMGAVAVPLSFLFGPDALAYRLENSEAKVALVDPQSAPNLAPIRGTLHFLTQVLGVAGAGAKPARLRRFRRCRVAALRPPTRRATPALIVYTAARPGRPKALIAHRCLLGNLSGFCTRTTASRSRATFSGRRPTGPGPAG
jgi:acetyl-CoA synthetase